MTIYKMSVRSLTLEEMLTIRKWLRLCYVQSEGDVEKQKELLRVGLRLNDCISVASATDCQIAEW